jgi:hypothetical protein
MRPALLLLALPLLGIGGCARDACTNTLVARHVDPATTLIAYVLVRDCGATTDYATNVAIGRTGEPQSNAHVAFTADSGHGAAQIDGNAIWLRANWTGPGKLSIAYADRSRVFRKEASFAGAQISYRVSAPFEDRVAPIQ